MLSWDSGYIHLWLFLCACVHDAQCDGNVKISDLFNSLRRQHKRSVTEIIPATIAVSTEHRHDSTHGLVATNKNGPDRILVADNSEQHESTTNLPVHLTYVSPINLRNSSVKRFNYTIRIPIPPRPYDILVGNNYLCDSDQDCKLMLENSECFLKQEKSVGMSSCMCKLGYVYDGNGCVTKGSVHYCSSHEECRFALLNSRCVNVIGPVNITLCKCLRNHIIDNSSCLPKVPYGGFCTSSKQCQKRTECLSNECRLGCTSEYSWRDDHCVKDGTNPKFNNGFFANNEAVVFTIIGGLLIPLALIVFLTTLFLRSRWLAARSTGSNSGENSASVQPYAPVFHQPPSYEEAVTGSTEMLVTNAQETFGDAPPSYSSSINATSNK